MQNLSNLLFQHAASNRCAVIDKHLHWSYSSLCDSIIACSKVLKEYAPETGRIGIALPNNVSFLIAIYSIWKIDRCAALFDYTLQQSEVIEIAAQMDVSCILMDPFKSIESGFKIISIFNNIGVTYSTPLNIENTCDIRCSDMPEEALCQYTSGVTGKPKLVTRTHIQISEEISGFIKAIRGDDNDSVIVTTPFHHSYALIPGILSSLSRSAQLIIQTPFSSDQVFNLLAKYRNVILLSTPFYYGLMIPQLRHVNFEWSIRFAISAGAPLLPKTQETFLNNNGVHIRQLYGTTETGVISVNTDDNVSNSVGKTIEGVQVKIVDDAGKVVRIDDIGYCNVMSSHAAISYLNQPDLANTLFKGEWFFTGDRAKINKEGLIFIYGKSDDTINFAGKKIDPLEVESILIQHPQILDAVVCGAKHRMFGEIIQAHVIFRTPVDDRELIRFCKSKLAEYKVPMSIKTVNYIPRSVTGKALRNLLKQESSHANSQ